MYCVNKSCAKKADNRGKSNGIIHHKVSQHVLIAKSHADRDLFSISNVLWT